MSKDRRLNDERKRMPINKRLTLQSSPKVLPHSLSREEKVPTVFVVTAFTVEACASMEMTFVSLADMCVYDFRRVDTTLH